ncbi:hypothetical protein Tco_0844923 [Tanacetum coccineum]
MSWLGSTNAYNKPIGSLGTMEDEAENLIPQSTPQVLPSFKEIVSSSEEPITNEPTTQVSDDNADESVQEDTAELEGNTFINSFYSHVLEEANSSSTNLDLSNMNEFYQQHLSTNQ